MKAENKTDWIETQPIVPDPDNIKSRSIKQTLFFGNRMVLAAETSNRKPGMPGRNVSMPLGTAVAVEHDVVGGECMEAPHPRPASELPVNHT